VFTLKVKELQKYSKKLDYTYSFGSFPTLELLKNRQEQVKAVIIHPSITEEIYKNVKQYCTDYKIFLLENERIFARICNKENIFLIGVVRKYEEKLGSDANHVVIVSPSDMGNLGTIVRTCVGFGIQNLALIEPAADVFNPKTIRASMGSLFSIKFQSFPSFEQYTQQFGKKRKLYSFMLNGKRKLGSFSHTKTVPYSLIFGNESSGLGDSYLEIGQSIFIKHTNNIDSLNLSLAVGIAIYEFTKLVF
jgi:TrmH family RNA methyltransferase